MFRIINRLECKHLYFCGILRSLLTGGETDSWMKFEIYNNELLLTNEIIPVVYKVDRCTFIINIIISRIMNNKFFFIYMFFFHFTRILTSIFLNVGNIYQKCGLCINSPWSSVI